MIQMVDSMNNVIEFSPKYACPSTHSALHFKDDVLIAADGSAIYPIVAGIPQFLRFESAEDVETNAQLVRLNQLARVEGWRNALNAIYGENASIVRYVTDATRGSFIDLLPITKQSDVLEIGPGLGQFTCLLAIRAKSVYGLEVVPGQTEFTAERCRQEGVTNVHLAAGGDDCRLPYGDQTFDLVVVNLVLEWCGMRCLEEALIDVQRRFLSEVVRVLKPGGTFYLATKNRFALRLIIGKSDPHCYGIHFGSALPRWLSRLFLRLKGHSRPFGLLHSHAGLQAMLHDAGFEKTKSFWATPEMRFPVQYVPTDAASISEARRNPDFIQGEGRSTKLLMRFVPSFLVKHFTPGLAFLATKPS
jgi:ubiquinone/menaquinone biosynthesis C-methylase UbiE/uncharacterized protein YbaR (Trm112 family)